MPAFPLVVGPDTEAESMRYVWMVFWGACGLLVVMAGVRAFVRARPRPDGRSPSVDDDAVRRIIDEGVLASEEDEPLDLDGIEEEERRFWEETWEDADEW